MWFYKLFLLYNPKHNPRRILFFTNSYFSGNFLLLIIFVFIIIMRSSWYDEFVTCKSHFLREESFYLLCSHNHVWITTVDDWSSLDQVRIIMLSGKKSIAGWNPDTLAKTLCHDGLLLMVWPWQFGALAPFLLFKIPLREYLLVTVI